MSNASKVEVKNDGQSKKVPPDGGWGWVVVCAFSFYVVSVISKHFT